MKVHAKKGEVILLDLSIALDFAFYNTKAHSKRETLSSGHKAVGGHTVFDDLEDSDGTNDNKWLIPHCGWPSQFLLFLSSLWSKHDCIYFENQERKPNGPMVFKLYLLYIFFVVYMSCYAWKSKQMKQCEYGFKAFVNPKVWLTRKETHETA